MNDYYYYKEKNGNLYRFRIEQDDEPWHPRYDCDGNVGHMMCWYSGYNLGDYKENTYKDPDEFLNDLIRKNYTDKQLVSYVRSGKASNNLEIVYDHKEQTYDLMGDYRVWWNGNKIHHGSIDSQSDILWLDEAILDALPISDKIALLERKDYFFMGLSVYEHSGITMYVGRPSDHYDGQWDCSYVGWIYTTKKEILECGGQLKGKRKWRKVTNRNWKEAAQTWLEGEVEIYDMYLTGEVYGYIKEKWDGYDWIDDDSCWGFYSKKWGDELALEIAHEGFTDEPLISEEEMETLCEAYTKQFEEDELIDSVAMVFA